MAASRVALTRPHISLAFLEVGRALGEFSLLPAAELPLRLAPEGDGHTVLVCPGFLTSDGSTGPLRRFIRSKGYNVYGWNLGRNLGPATTGSRLELLEDLVESLKKQSHRKISIVGWSLGGVMAREIAKQRPELVRQVITLGSPLHGQPESSNVNWIYTRVAKDAHLEEEIEKILEQLHEPPEKVPSTSIFSKTDGVVPWRGCIEPETPITDNIEVYASHCGLGVNPFVYFAIADRLALPENDWTPFDRNASAWRQLAYPSSGHGYNE